jgi:transposase
MNESVAHETRVTGGVDTHKDTHTAAAIDASGRALGTATFAATAAGYQELLEWLLSFGAVERVGIEGTGSYGSGLAEHLRRRKVSVLEVGRPNRQERRRHGKSDEADGVAAARAALADEALGVPKSQDGTVEAIRILRLERRSAIHARTKAANRLHAVVATAPEGIRARLRELSLALLIERSSKSRKVDPTHAVSATQRVLQDSRDAGSTSIARWLFWTPSSRSSSWPGRPHWSRSEAWESMSPARFSLRQATTQNGSPTKLPSQRSAGSHPSTLHLADNIVID